MNREFHEPGEKEISHGRGRWQALVMGRVNGHKCIHSAHRYLPGISELSDEQPHAQPSPISPVDDQSPSDTWCPIKPGHQPKRWQQFLRHQTPSKRICTPLTPDILSSRCVRSQQSQRCIPLIRTPPSSITKREKPELALDNNTAGVREREDPNRTREAGHLDQIQGVVATTLTLDRNGASLLANASGVGFIRRVRR